MADEWREVPGPDHRLERLLFFSDAVFAIAITLLIIEVRVPHLGPNASNAAWGNALLAMTPSFAAFILSFFVVGALWASHHATFSLLAKFDQRLVWPSLLMLMSVAFLPFSTTLLSQGSLSPVPFAFYAATLLLAALLKAWVTKLALRPDLIAPGVAPARIAIELRRRWVMPAAALLTLLLAFAVPGWNAFGMLLIVVLRRLPFFRLPPDTAA